MFGQEFLRVCDQKTSQILLEMPCMVPTENFISRLGILIITVNVSHIFTRYSIVVLLTYNAIKSNTDGEENEETPKTVSLFMNVFVPQALDKSTN